MKQNETSDAAIQYEEAMQYIADLQRGRRRRWEEAVRAAGGEIKLPVKYEDVPYQERRVVRDLYVKLQGGLCWYCKELLENEPPQTIMEKEIDWDQFPDGFRNYPVHLQHDHETGWTEGAVHAYCNAVLWQYDDK